MLLRRREAGGGDGGGTPVDTKGGDDLEEHRKPAALSKDVVHELCGKEAGPEHPDPRRYVGGARVGEEAGDEERKRDLHVAVDDVKHELNPDRVAPEVPASSHHTCAPR